MELARATACSTISDQHVSQPADYQEVSLLEAVNGHVFKCWAARNADSILYHMFQQV